LSISTPNRNVSKQRFFAERVVGPHVGKQVPVPRGVGATLCKPGVLGIALVRPKGIFTGSLPLSTTKPSRF
jgi:hypothetical protein